MPLKEVPQENGSADPDYLAKLQMDCARTDSQRFIEYSERSTGQLRNKMISLGYSAETAEATVEWAVKYGFVDDNRFSEMFAASKIMGKLRLKVELNKRGVGEEAISHILSSLSDESEFSDVAAAVRKKYGGIVNRETAVRRAAGWLERRGYSGEFIHRILREVL